jgi:hypothetical protein
LKETRIVDEDMDVKLYNGFPVLEELINEGTTDMSIFEVKKCIQFLYLGKNLSTKNKNYYLYNKIEYYRNFKLIKEKQNNELERKIIDKNQILQKLKEEIQVKEEEHQKVRKLLNVFIDDSNYILK